MWVFRVRWAWLLVPLLAAYAVGLPLLFVGVDAVLRRLGTAGADVRVFLAAIAVGTSAVLLNARRDRLVVDSDGVRLSEGEAPVDVLAPWSAVQEVRRRRRGPLTLDTLVLDRARLVRRDPSGASGLRGPLRERAFRWERDRRGISGRAEVNLTRYCRGGWDGPLGEVVRRHRPDLGGPT